MSIDKSFAAASAEDKALSPELARSDEIKLKVSALESERGRLTQESNQAAARHQKAISLPLLERDNETIGKHKYDMNHPKERIEEINRELGDLQRESRLLNAIIRLTDMNPNVTIENLNEEIEKLKEQVASYKKIIADKTADPDEKVMTAGEIEENNLIIETLEKKVAEISSSESQ